MSKFKVKSGKHYRKEKDGVKVYCTGDVIEAEEHELRNCMDKFERLDPKKPEEAMKPKVGLKAVHRGGGKYNVINERSGKPINDQLLSREEAEQLANRGFDENIVEEPEAAGDVTVIEE